MGELNVSRNPEEALPQGYSHNGGKPFNLANFAGLTPEDEYEHTVLGAEGEPVVISEQYSEEEWAALCEHRRGNGIGGVDG